MKDTFESIDDFIKGVARREIARVKEKADAKGVYIDTRHTDTNISGTTSPRGVSPGHGVFVSVGVVSI